MGCPCGLPQPYEQCCGRYHHGEPAPTALALMRSRYCAFTKGLWPYLAQTQAAPFGNPPPQQLWLGLTVHQATENEVEFTARHLDRDREVSLHERSRFERHQGRWRYVDGDLRLTTRKLSRNDPCACGSGRKLKACHGAL